jgi:hypothetical protein
MGLSFHNQVIDIRAIMTPLFGFWIEVMDPRFMLIYDSVDEISFIIVAR